MIPAEIIKQKRRGETLSDKLIDEFVGAYLSGDVADYQMSAFLMAVFFKGLTTKETWALTKAMLHSGEVVNLDEIPGAKIDKHSTGGVGDKTSLIAGPMVAAAGILVPMISGRGLGHTGGTLDKLESIPGFSTQLSLIQFKAQIAKLGICFIGQTESICPADKKMYALRDVTGTVESIPLICASIMSKKLAEGIDGLVLDVKTGTGAFMKSEKEAVQLAKALRAIGKAGSKKVTALITDMNQPLGNAVGNSLEVQECLEVLNSRGPEDLRSLCIELSAHMILLGKKAKNLKEAKLISRETLTSGRALTLFERVVEAQGGKLALPVASQKVEVTALKSGFVHGLNAEKIGLASLSLGAGRLKSADSIDPSAGIIINKKIGDQVKKGETIAILHFNNHDPNEAEQLIGAAYEIRLQKVPLPRLIKKVFAAGIGSK